MSFVDIGGYGQYNPNSPQRYNPDPNPYRDAFLAIQVRSDLTSLHPGNDSSGPGDCPDPPCNEESENQEDNSLQNSDPETELTLDYELDQYKGGPGLLADIGPGGPIKLVRFLRLWML